MGKRPIIIVSALLLVVAFTFLFILNSRESKAQSTVARPLIVADIDEVNGLQTSNPLANYPAGNPSYPGQEVGFDNEGISVFIMPATSPSATVTTDGNVPECGHLGLQEWKGSNYAWKLADANTWQKRRSSCAGIVVIGSSGQIRAQTLTLKGTSVEGKRFTLQINVPAPSLWDNEVGGGSRRLYVDDTGAAYACKSLTYRNPWPNECEFSPQQAVQMAAVASGSGAVSGNGLCQAGETYANAPDDCVPNYSFGFSMSASAGAAGTIEAGYNAKATTRMKIKNTGDTETTYSVSCTTTPANLRGEYRLYAATESSAGTAYMLPIAAGVEKEFTYTFDLNTITATISVQVLCSANRSGGAVADAKTVSDSVQVMVPIATLSGTIFKNGQFIDPLTGTTRNCVSPNGWAKDTVIVSGARNFSCRPYFTPAPADLPPPTCAGTLWATAGTGLTNDYCAVTQTGTTTTTTTSPATSTTGCSTPDNFCVATGQIVPYATGKWCQNSQQYYSSDGKMLACVEQNAAPPAGYKSCWPGDSSRPADRYCKEHGESWTGTDTNSTNYYCSGGQKCNAANSGGSCVGWNETCPAGTRYCMTSSPECMEPDTYRSITAGGSSPWCGSGGMTFYSASQVYCPQKSTNTNTIGTMAGYKASEMKAILDKLGAGWGLCRSSDTNCIEPGKTGPSSGWCAWMPPTTTPQTTTSPSGATARTCPALNDDAVTSTQRPVAQDQTTPPATTPPATPPATATVVPVPYSEMRECGQGEMPMAENNCRMPMYRWNFTAKSWEKCDAKNPPVYVNIKENPKANYTNCESMVLDVEKDWKTERNLLHDPRIDGEWYMPPWDAAAESSRYNPKTDKFESCSLRENSAMPAPVNGYVPPCMPVPAKDAGWLLKKARAEYKMSQMWNTAATRSATVTPATGTALPTQDQTLPVQPTLEPAVPLMTLETLIKPTVPVIEIPAKQCRGYLAGIRSTLASDKQFWKDAKGQLDRVGDSYPDAEVVKPLLDQTKALILEMEKLIRLNQCGVEAVSGIQEKSQTLHTDIFPELSSYLPSIRDYVEYKQCRASLEDKKAMLKKLEKNAIAGDKTGIGEVIKSIEDSLVELQKNEREFDYDLAFECRQMSQDLNSQAAPLLRTQDVDINRIIDTVVSKKLEPVVDRLSKQLEERGKKLDELLVQVASLQKTLESVSNTATQISERVAVSYSALSYIQDKYAEQKTQIQAAKDRLIPLIEKATNLVQQTKCIKGSAKDQIVQEFGNIASVNWIGDEADALAQRLNVFINSCEGRSIAASDITAFVSTVDNASMENQKLSYTQGLTKFPDVPTHEWYYGGMQSAYENGYMTQGRPAENVLQQDALLMIVRAVGIPDSELNGDCEVPNRIVVSPYARCAVKAGLARGLVLPSAMNAVASRVEIAQWISKLTAMPVGTESIIAAYTDLKGLNADQLSAVSSVVNGEIMVGNNNAFQPYNPLTRAALAVILDKIAMAARH